MTKESWGYTRRHKVSERLRLRWPGVSEDEISKAVDVAQRDSEQEWFDAAHSALGVWADAGLLAHSPPLRAFHDPDIINRDAAELDRLADRLKD